MHGFAQKKLIKPRGDLIENFLSHLDDSVSQQMVSDVPFGAFLSGGLDSSTIVALMSRHNSKIKTFSVGFADDSFSELAYAAEVAKCFGTQHHEIIVDPRDVIDKLPQLVGYRDAPVSEPAAPVFAAISGETT